MHKEELQKRIDKEKDEVIKALEDKIIDQNQAKVKLEKLNEETIKERFVKVNEEKQLLLEADV